MKTAFSFSHEHRDGRRCCRIIGKFLFAIHFFFLFAIRGYSEELPSPRAFQVYNDPIPGPRITPYLRYQLDQAWQQDANRIRQWAAIRTEAELHALQEKIRKELLDLLKAQFGLRMQLATQQLSNSSQISKVRRDIARVRTLIREKAVQQ